MRTIQDPYGNAVEIVETEPRHVPALSDVDAELCRRSLAHFVRAAWPYAPNATKGAAYKHNWHVDAICQHLEAVVRREIQFLLINQPPRTGKSIFTSVMLLPWVWLTDPSYSAIYASVTSSLSTDGSVHCRELLDSPWYRALVANTWKLRDDKNVKSDFANTAGGSRFATSVGGTVIGRGAALIVGDDLEDDKTVQTETGRRATRDYWDGTLSSRAADPARVTKICVQQRLHRQDISSHLIASGMYTHLRLDNEYDPRRSCVTVVADKEFWRDPRTADGELLNALGHSKEEAERVRDRAKTYGSGVGPVRYRAQYRQDPIVESGGEAARPMWRFFSDPRYPAGGRPEGCATEAEAPAVKLPRDIELVYLQSADTAYKDSEAADSSCIGIGAYEREKPARVYLLDVVSRKVLFEDLVKMLLEQRKRYPLCTTTYVEDRVSGTSLVQVLQPRVTGIVPVLPEGSKPRRMRLSTLPRLEAGQIYLPEGAPWLEYLVGEHADFPHGDHDDSVDMLSQLISKVEGVRGDLDLIEALGKW